MEVLNYLFKDKKWQIYQDSEMFNFSIDSLLLARKTKIIKNDQDILEIGTNNGVIAIILALKFPDLKIKALEIQKQAYEIAVKNCDLNKVTNNIDLENVDFNDWIIENVDQKFDLIICNPPFFKSEQNKTNNNRALMIARHEVKLTLENIISNSTRLLNKKGRLSLIYPPSRLKEIFLLAKQYDFAISKMQFIFSKITKKAQSVLLELNWQGKHNLIVDKPFIIQDQNNQYTKQAKSIYFWESENIT